MSLVNEDGSSAIEASESINESERKPRVSYTRDFLLSISDLEMCKKLPSGFDQSILRISRNYYITAVVPWAFINFASLKTSELEEASVQERPRTHGNLPLQGFRRNDYSSSPPTRGDSSTYSRGTYGRWDSRSSGWSDKDGDSQSDLDPDSGRRSYGNNQSRRPWQNSNSEHDGLLGSGSFPRPCGFAPGTSAPKSQSNDHYPLSRSNEAYQPPRPFKAVPHARTNTHDSFNDETFGSSDNASQDRAEEERKRRASFELMRKEQQKVLQEKQKSSGNKVKNDEFTEMILEESKEAAALESSGELNSKVQSVPNDDSVRSSVLLQSSKPRPLVPPGFKTTITTKPISSTEKENPKPGIEEIHLVGKGNHQTQNGTLDKIQSLHKLDIPEKGESVVVSKRISVFPEVHEAVDGEVFELNKILSNSTQESSTSILGKFFGSTPGIKETNSAGFLEYQTCVNDSIFFQPQKNKPDDPLVQSSRFAQWFNEDEKKPVNDYLSSTGPNNLLSLIVGGDKSGSQLPNILPTDPTPPFGGVITNLPSDPNPNPNNHMYNNNYRHDPTPAPPPVAAVLTCEDLEQTILSEYTDKTSTNLQPPPVTVNTHTIPVDNTATNHLLSLLQKGTATDDDIKPPSENHHHHHNPPSEKPKDESNNNLSLESLFGTAFMKELQSAQAPVSAQRAAPGSARIDTFDPHNSTADGMGIGMGLGSYENNPLSLMKQPVNPENWLNLNNNSDNKGKQAGEIELPEEESLISETGFDISEKLAALNSGFRGGGEQRFVRGPYDMLEPERQFSNNNLIHPHPQASSPQMHAQMQQQMSHNPNRRPMFHPLDPNSPMRFPEHLNQQFQGNMAFHHQQHHRPDTRVTGFDVPGHHPQMLPPQMRMQGNFAPPHLMSRPLPPKFMGDREAVAGMHGFPFGGHQQPNLVGPGLGGDGGSGSNHPEVLQRMLEMELELRAHAKQQQVRPGGMYGGHELDFRYR
ncbi:hypothetical protein LXL04_010729 [Taraxacum kok-saghyz]